MTFFVIVKLNSMYSDSLVEGDSNMEYLLYCPLFCNAAPRDLLAWKHPAIGRFSFEQQGTLVTSRCLAMGN